MFRIVMYSTCIAVFLLGGWWYSEEAKHFTSKILPTPSEGNILTIESHLTAEELLKNKRGELLKNKSYELRTASACFFPYLLLEAKYTNSDRKTIEGHILWSLCEGEMVLSTDSFEMTHGFEDCIHAQATEDDFKILNALAARGGALSQDGLTEEIKMSSTELFDKINSLKRKHLISVKGAEIRLHLQNALMKVVPQTKIQQPIVAKQLQTERLMPPRYSVSEIRKLSQAAFGQDFGIRREEKIYIPAIQIEVQNPDGSISKSFWNAITGKKIELKQLDYFK